MNNDKYFNDLYAKKVISHWERVFMFFWFGCECITHNMIVSALYAESGKIISDKLQLSKVNADNLNMKIKRLSIDMYKHRKVLCKELVTIRMNISKIYIDIENIVISP